MTPDRLFAAYEEARADITAHFRKILELQAANTELTRKLEIAREALRQYSLEYHHGFIAREALKELE